MPGAASPDSGRFCKRFSLGDASAIDATTLRIRVEQISTADGHIRFFVDGDRFDQPVAAIDHLAQAIEVCSRALRAIRDRLNQHGHAAAADQAIVPAIIVVEMKGHDLGSSANRRSIRAGLFASPRPRRSRRPACPPGRRRGKPAWRPRPFAASSPASRPPCSARTAGPSPAIDPVPSAILACRRLAVDWHSTALVQATCNESESRFI